VIGEASVLQNVMIGGTIEGEATFVEALLALPRKCARRADAGCQSPRAARVVGLEMLADVPRRPLAAQRTALIEIARALMLSPEFPVAR